MKALLLILKTLGDFFLDAKGDGDPMRFWASASFVAAVVTLCLGHWEYAAACAAVGILLFVLVIWREREHASKKLANPTQGQVG